MCGQRMSGVAGAVSGGFAASGGGDGQGVAGADRTLVDTAPVKVSSLAPSAIASALDPNPGNHHRVGGELPMSLCIGTCAGAVAGMLLDSLGICLAIGAAAGIIIGVVLAIKNYR